MGKVELRMNEEYKYKIIKKLVETNGNKWMHVYIFGLVKKNLLFMPPLMMLQVKL